MTPVDALQKACELAGGQSALAAELTKRQSQPISPARVWNWINRDGQAPTDFCALIEQIVNGKVTRQQLSPIWRTVWPDLIKAAGAPPLPSKEGANV